MTSFDMASFNNHRAHLLIDTLYKQGVTQFCLAPGSRSSVLAIAIGEHPHVKSFIHFDERGLGFYALGLAKASQSPVALLVTTGTAVANLFPSIMESDLSQIPLLILTADRPPELRDCGANQTADHVKIFTSSTRWEVDLAFSDPLASNQYIASTISHAVNRCRQSPKGPVQINCMIREPSFSKEPVEPFTLSSCIYEPKETTPPFSSFQTWGSLLSSIQKGVILLGSDALEKEDIEDLLTCAHLLGWPIFSNVLSGGRQIGDHPHHIEYFELLLKAFPDLQVDAILQIGNRLVSKPLLQWIEKQKNALYFLVTDHPFRQDPLHKVTRKMECKTSFFCHSLKNTLSLQTNPWAPLWKSEAKKAREAISSFFTKEETFSEMGLFHYLSEKINTFPLFLANSMPIRDADLLFFPQEGTSLIFANRGVSGIDGNIATALGLTSGLQEPLIAFLGDLATLHDLNSFALAKKNKVPTLFIIINNQGGGIFSFLPVAEKKELFEEFIATAHPYNFSPIAEMFSLSYDSIHSLDSFKKAFINAIASQKSCIIECHTVREENAIYHQALINKVKDSLCSTFNLLDPLPAH